MTEDSKTTVSELCSLGDVLKKATDENNDGIITHVKGFGKMKFKMLTPPLAAMLRKRATTGVDKVGRPIIDENEMLVLMADACLMDPKIPEDKLRKFGFGYLNTVGNAINRISGIATNEKEEQGQVDF